MPITAIQFTNRMQIAFVVVLAGKVPCLIRSRNAYGCCGCRKFAMGVRLIWYGCPPASMGVSTPTVEYNSPPMDSREPETLPPSTAVYLREPLAQTQELGAKVFVSSRRIECYAT